MCIVKKLFGLWHVRNASNTLTQFKSLSRKAALEWCAHYNAAMAPLPVAERLNITVNHAVWRAR